ncbi:MAG: proline--tRNA ligase [Acidimicrobiaceae bacterium]|jgi:prolyl-tRNA synthetase family II|nr:proline--tRNA ligase [Acidimicrobiaceae bacterium]MBT5582101.1 proline--tRNA ligase [Acidimicrobiaceae bacterium]MBT5852298.1 proline--tRNA ligase [Acidimicrobiaceae bacterium]
MRWSNLHTPTLRDAPADAEAASHKLLVRGGFIRQLHAGHYSLLPLGWRVFTKVEKIVREEMNAIGGQEFLLPAMHPASVWKKSGRWDVMGDEMFRVTDRKGAENALGMTHEEIFTTLAVEITSYKSLPQIWYQIQTKFRDEPRPKSGLLRVREFAMKDSYSFDIDQAGLDKNFVLHHDAYVRIFERLGLPAMPVEASSGAMGGSGSTEFMVPSPAGEDDVVRCNNCDYAANVERSSSALPMIEDRDLPELIKFPTPGVRTIAALEAVDGGAPADHQIKTMVMVLDGDVTLALVRGDHQLNLQKLQDSTGAIDIRPATPEEAKDSLGARPGSLGAVEVEGLRIVADPVLRGRAGLTTGANTDDWHFTGVNIERDIAVDEWMDLRDVSAGEACINCGEPLEIVRCIEAGHIFKLGTKYAEALGAHVMDPNGTQCPLVMGSYGIGIERNVAAIAETYHDENGLNWPTTVAPFEAVITIVSLKDDASVTAAEAIYDELKAKRIDVLLDDRDARAGVKFADAELIGIPYRITIGPKALAEGEVEFTARAAGETTRVNIDAIVDQLVATLTS